jgi:hypothetical protein
MSRSAKLPQTKERKAKQVDVFSNKFCRSDHFSNEASVELAIKKADGKRLVYG